MPVTFFSIYRSPTVILRGAKLVPRPDRPDLHHWVDVPNDAVKFKPVPEDVLFNMGIKRHRGGMLTIDPESAKSKEEKALLQEDIELLRQFCKRKPSEYFELSENRAANRNIPSDFDRDHSPSCIPYVAV